MEQDRRKMRLGGTEMESNWSKILIKVVKLPF